jgi:RND family efflux transporter MFP subunit
MKPGHNLFAILLCSAVLAGCGKSADKAATTAAEVPAARPIAAAAVATAEVRSLQPGFEHPAVIEAMQSASIRAEVSATLVASHFSPGDIVEKDALLVELDDAKYQAAYNVAKASVQSAQAGAAQAKTNWERAQKLRPDGYISALDFDKARAAIDTANAAVASAKARLDEAAIDVQHTKIYAPFRGRISKINYANGDLVNAAIPNAPPIFELVQLDPIYAKGSVAQGVYNNFVLMKKKMNDEGVAIPDVKVTLVLAGGGDYPEVGTFENWSHSSTGSSGMITGRVIFPNPEGMLLPGENVTLMGKALRSVERVMVPQKAVNQDQQGHFVMVVTPENTVERRNIEVGIRDGSDWAVRSGLEAGEMVIAEGAQTFKPGTMVEIKGTP